ncbi:MAG: hypothetical protein ACOZNI_17650 [Myxococcota bacterium]
MIEWVAIAAAAEVVVYEDGAADEAIARVVAVAGVDAATLRATPLSELLAGRPPVGLGGARVIACAEAPAANAAVAEAIQRADGALAYMEYESARRDLAIAAARLACLSEPVDPQLAARLWYMRGIAAFADGDTPAARRHFQRARLFDPRLAWDEDFAPDARPTFDGAVDDLRVAEAVWVTIVPLPDGLLVDGRPAAAPEGRVAMPPGEHIVQVGTGPVTTLQVEVDPGGEPTVVVPALVPARLERTPALSAALAATVHRDATVYAVTRAGAVWRVHAGRDDWETLGGGSVAEAAAPVAPAKPGTRLGRWLLGGGAAVLAGGGVLAGVSWANGTDAVADAGAAPNEATWLLAEDRYDNAAAGLLAGELLAVAGIGLVGAGVVLAW